MNENIETYIFKCEVDHRSSTHAVSQEGRFGNPQVAVEFLQVSCHEIIVMLCMSRTLSMIPGIDSVDLE